MCREAINFYLAMRICHSFTRAKALANRKTSNQVELRV